MKTFKDAVSDVIGTPDLNESKASAIKETKQIEKLVKSAFKMTSNKSTFAKEAEEILGDGIVYDVESINSLLSDTLEELEEIRGHLDALG